MKLRYYGAAMALLTIPTLSSAQTTGAKPDPLLPDAAALLKEGVGLHDKGQYAEAAARYQLITPGDSAYAQAQAELAMSLVAADKYPEGVAAAQRALALNPHDPETLGVLASGQEGLKQLDAARQTYTQALKLFPYNERLWLNRGIAEYNLGKPELALAYMQRAMVLRPGHSTPHRLLGVLAARQGQPTHAMLGLLLFLAIEPEGERSQSVLVLLEKLSSGQPIVDDAEKVAASSPNAAFEELDQLITSKVALTKDYVTKVKFNAALVKQTQLLVEKFPVEADPASDFWVRAYAPVIKLLRQEDNITTFTYLILLSAQDDHARQWVKANKSRVEKLTTALSEPLLALRDQQPLPEGALAAAWYDGPVPEGLGAGTRDAKGTVLPTGPWLLLAPSGAVRQRGSFAGPGKRGGRWQVLRPDGSIETEENYASTGAALGELDGPTRTFFPDGQLKSEATYRAGKLEGPGKTYTESGKVSESRTFVNNDYEGEVTGYFPDGTPRFRGQMHADKREGTLTYYYPTGAPEARYAYVANQRQGPYEVFYVNKVLEHKGTYDKGELTGSYTANYPNGQLRETGTYAQGKRTGLWREYFASGKLSVESSYDAAGELHGAYRDYDTQGRHFADIYYEHGRMTRLVNFDAAGKTIADMTLKKGRQAVKTYDAEGRVRGTGFIENGALAGEWRRLFPDGSLREVAHYDNKGTLVGGHELYYATGQLRQRRTYAPDGTATGYFEQFYLDGQPQQVGFYRQGQPQGEWKSYYADGRPSQVREYHQGDLNGALHSYAAGGKLADERIYEFGKLRQVVTYDSAGRVIDRLPLLGKTSEVVVHFPGSGPQGGVLNRVGYCDGTYEGPMSWLYPNGQPETTLTLHADKQYGPYRSLFPGGQTRTEGEYLAGERYGEFKTYYADGTLRSRGRYLSNDQVGEWTYNFANGKPEKVLTFNDEGELQGTSRYYNPAGELLLEQQYLDGTLESSSAPGGAAQALPPAGGAVAIAFANGKPAAAESYQHGYPAAPFVYYYSTGQVFRRIGYQKGLRSGPLVSYWPNGKPMEEENYQHGELHGRCRYYRPDGTIEREETYVAGERCGPSISYTAQGKPAHTEAYWNNAFYHAK